MAASILDYNESLRISRDDPSFAALIFAAIRKADSYNIARFRMIFPELYDEFMLRHRSPGGAINESEKAILFLRTEHEEENEGIAHDAARAACEKLDAEMTGAEGKG